MEQKRKSVELLAKENVDVAITKSRAVVPKKQVGRKPKNDPAKYRYTISLTEEENIRFLNLFESSGMSVKAHFITATLFQKPIRVVKIDKNTSDYYMRLTTLFNQFRAIGINYNQVTKAIKTVFSEKKALHFLFRLEKSTKELIEINQKVIELTQQFETKWLQK